MIISIARASYCFVAAAPILLPPASMWWTSISSASWKFFMRQIVNAIVTQDMTCSPSRWWRCLRCGSAAAPLLRQWVRIPPGHGWFSVVSIMCCQVEVSATG